MASIAVGNDGQTHHIGYSLIVSASVDYEWESDEHPTGWNYKTDNATYSSSTYASISNVTMHSIEPDTSSPCYYDNEEVSMETLQQNLPLSTQKQLLNPTTIADLMNSSFANQAEKLDPPDPDDYFDEPDYDDRNY
ncbi:MAG TPA: hypothetical protein VIY47_09505 [Ignavibacteriaceae bacterium]